MAEGQPIVKIQYHKLKEEDSLFKIDGAALGQALDEIGYPPSTIRPLVISGDNDAYSLGFYNPLTRKVTIYNSALIKHSKAVYRSLFERLGEAPPGFLIPHVGLRDRLANSKLGRIIDPDGWAYKMAKNAKLSLFTGQRERRINYVTASTEGNLEPGKPIEEQKARAKEFSEKIIERALGRYVATILAHEYEHANGSLRKNAVLFGLAFTPPLAAIAGCRLISANESFLNSPVGTGLFILLAVGGLFGIPYGLIKGKSLDERSSFDIQNKNFRAIKGAVTINHDVFAKEILGRADESLTVDY